MQGGKALYCWKGYGDVGCECLDCFGCRYFTRCFSVFHFYGLWGRCDTLQRGIWLKEPSLETEIDQNETCGSVFVMNVAVVQLFPVSSELHTDYIETFWWLEGSFNLSSLLPNQPVLILLTDFCVWWYLLDIPETYCQTFTQPNPALLL